MLARHGYGVLLFDRRGYGGARATPTCSAGTATHDIDAAVAWLARSPDVNDGRIGGIGLSVGGEMMLQTAAATAAARRRLRRRRRALRAEEGTCPTAAVRKPFTPMLMQTLAGDVLASTAADGPRRPHRSPRVPAADPRTRRTTRARSSTGPTTTPAARGPCGRSRAPGTPPQSRPPRQYERRVVGFFDRALLSGT